MLRAFFGRFYREILIIINIFTIYTWKWPFTNADPKWWQVLLFILSILIGVFSLSFVLYTIGEVDDTWRQKWKNFCKFDKRNCNACEHGEYCKYSTCQHKSLRNSRYYLLKLLGH